MTEALALDTIYCGDALAVLKTLPDASVHCIVTSPPYFGLRDYGVDGQIGWETTVQDYVQALVAVFREARRVLRSDGVMWVNLGDSYAQDSKWGGSTGGKHAKALHGNSGIGRNRHQTGLVGKNLIGIPWRVAFALQDDGWILRSDIIWSKPNPMPESVTDRPTKSHEYVFLFAKSPQYYYDAEAIKEPAIGGSGGDFSQKYAEAQPEHGRTKQDATGNRRHTGFNGRWKHRQQHKNMSVPGRTTHSMHERRANGLGEPDVERRNKRTVWTVSPTPLKEAHFATFPPKLVEPMILAGCPVGGVVLDTFFGAGTTGMVARRLDRHFVGIELNPDYIVIAERRLAKPFTLRMFEVLP